MAKRHFKHETQARDRKFHSHKLQAPHRIVDYCTVVGLRFTLWPETTQPVNYPSQVLILRRN